MTTKIQLQEYHSFSTVKQALTMDKKKKKIIRINLMAQLGALHNKQ